MIATVEHTKRAKSDFLTLQAHISKTKHDARTHFHDLQEILDGCQLHHVTVTC